MIELIDLNNSEPYSIFEDLYKKAVIKKQKHIEAIAISSFDNKVNSPDSRFVNLKYVINDEWIFFSNYESPKACLLYTSPSPRDAESSRMPSSA